MLFFFLLVHNYIGAVGRIERRNQFSNSYQNLGPVSKKEELALLEGTHKKLALKQAFIGALLWSLIAFGLMSLFI